MSWQSSAVDEAHSSVCARRQCDVLSLPRDVEWLGREDWGSGWWLTVLAVVVVMVVVIPPYRRPSLRGGWFGQKVEKRADSPLGIGGRRCLLAHLEGSPLLRGPSWGAPISLTAHHEYPLWREPEGCDEASVSPPEVIFQGTWSRQTGRSQQHTSPCGCRVEA